MQNRRLAAIMFTDIVGYTAIMGKDEDKAFNMISRNQIIQKSLIEKFNGTLVKEIGDGILASFPLTSDAVRCAIDIQKACSSEEIPIKIGIHEGEIIFSENDILGDTVNLASRLQESSKEGCIYISDTVYRNIKNKTDIQVEFIEERALKNVDEIIKIYNVRHQTFLPKDTSATIYNTYHPREKSIIVLPFENLSSDPEQEYFSDGLTEEIITDLSYIHDLLVISRNSAMTFKGSGKTTKEIAGKVNVRYVLEGSVRKSGNNLRITAQLIDALSDGHLWAHKYNGTLDDVFDIQEKVSQSIVDALKLRLTAQERMQMVKRPIENVEAFECYKRAMRYTYLYTEEGFRLAMQEIKNGLNIVGDNALLYAGLGLIYTEYYNSGILFNKEMLIKAEEMANKVANMEPDSVNANFLLGILARYKGDSKGVIFYLNQAYAIDPNNVEIALWLGYYNAAYIGRPELAKDLTYKIFELDPLSPINNFFPAIYYAIINQLDTSIIFLKKWQQMDPQNRWAKFILARHLVWNRQTGEAIEIIDQIVEDDKKDIPAAWSLFLKCAILGNQSEAKKIMTTEVKEYTLSDPEGPLFFAGMNAMLKDKEEAFNFLERAINRGWINYPLLSQDDPFLDNIRGEKRFKELMKKVKYEWENFEA